MNKKEISGFTLKCNCCDGPLLAQREDGTNVFMIFPDKIMAQMEASEHGVKDIVEVKISCSTNTSSI